MNNEKDFQTAWKEFKEAYLESLSFIVIPFVKFLCKTFKALSKFAHSVCYVWYNKNKGNQ